MASWAATAPAYRNGGPVIQATSVQRVPRVTGATRWRTKLGKRTTVPRERSTEWGDPEVSNSRSPPSTTLVARPPDLASKADASPHRGAASRG